MADFRDAAAVASRAILAAARGGDGEQSLCMPAGSRGIHYLLELPFTALSMVCMAIGFGSVPLSFLGFVPGTYVMPLLLGSLAISLSQRMVQSGVVRMVVGARREGFPRAFRDLPRTEVSIEDGNTARRVKLITEDIGTCLFDKERRRLLIEGVQYQYILFARDVLSVKPISGYAVSAACISCSIAGQRLELVMANARLGPIASLIHALNPSAVASEFSVRLNDTLFDHPVDTHEHRLPPPIPRMR